MSTTAWWDAFDEVIRDWIKDDPESMAAWEQHLATGDFEPLRRVSQRGQVGENAPLRTAMWEAFLYQRGHINAFQRVLLSRLKKVPVERHSARRWILDLGCGTGTVAFAFHEFFDGKARIHYIGQDHHEPSLTVCDDMLDGIVEATDAVTMFVEMENAFAAAAEQWPEDEACYVTCSYLLAQSECSQSTVDHIASLIGDLAQKHGRLRLVIADSTWPPSRAPRLVKRLQSDGKVTFDEDPRERIFNYTLEFPTMEGRGMRSRLMREVEGRYLVIEPR